LLYSRDLEPVQGKCEDRVVKDAMDAVGFQFLLGFVVIVAVFLVAEGAVLETVDMYYVCPISRFELVKLV